MTRHVRYGILAVTVLPVGAWLAGCAENQFGPATRPAQAAYSPPPGHEPTPDEVARMLEPNVLGVQCFFDPFRPWIWNSEHTQVCGIRVNALYLNGPNNLGVFGDGIIRPKLYVEYRDEQGKVQYKLVKEWAFTVEQAMQFRAKKRTKAGWGYALFLNWGDLNLSGRSIRLTIHFERADGIMITGGKKDFRVPKPEDEA